MRVDADRAQRDAELALMSEFVAAKEASARPPEKQLIDGAAEAKTATSAAVTTTAAKAPTTDGASGDEHGL